MTKGGRSGTLYAPMESLLSERQADYPDDLDLSERMMELFFEAGREEQFLAEARRVVGANPGLRDSEAWPRIERMGRVIAPDDELFSSPGSKASASEGAAEDDKRRQERFGELEKHREPLNQLARDYAALRGEKKFLLALDRELTHTCGRPSSLQHAARLSEMVGGAQIYLKREDLMPPLTALEVAVTGQALLAREFGRKRLIASTLTGTKGVVVARVAARLGLQALIFTDDRQLGNADELQIGLCGAELERIDAHRLKGRDVRTLALQHWSEQADSSLLVMGLDAGPPPYPMLVQEFAATVGRECLMQVRSQARRSPDLLVARGRKYADAIGFFAPFIGLKDTRLVCVDDADDKVPPEISDLPAEAQYPSVLREHTWLQASRRVEYESATLKQARRAMSWLAELEGMIPSASTAHTLAWACAAARKMPKDATVVVNVVGPVEPEALFSLVSGS